MQEIQGTFDFEGQTFKAGYRYDGQCYDKGGYDKCLRIYHNVYNQSIYAHAVFGDDKFEVENAEISDQTIVLTMHFPLCHKDKFFDPTASKILILKR